MTASFQFQSLQRGSERRSFASASAETAIRVVQTGGSAFAQNRPFRSLIGDPKSRHSIGGLIHIVPSPTLGFGQETLETGCVKSGG